MKVFILSTVLFLFTVTSYCQTKEETINWINTYGSSMLPEQTITISNDGNIQIHDYLNKNKGTITTVFEFNINDIYLPTKEDNVHFFDRNIEGKTASMSFSSSEEKIREYTPETKYYSSSTRYTTYTNIDFKDNDSATRFSKAFIHLAELYGCKPKPKKDLF